MKAPDWLPEKYHEAWLNPWDDKKNKSKSRVYRQKLRDKGYVTPHITFNETVCHDPERTPIPKSLEPNMYRHAWNLEKLRHELGDVPLGFISWYRTPAWNAHVGGASQSRHKSADATDFSTATVNRHGASTFDRACEKIFAQGGFGTYPSGSRHTDSRGSRARW